MIQELDHRLSRALFFGAKQSSSRRAVTIFLARWLIIIMGALVVLLTFLDVRRVALLALALAFGWIVNSLLGKFYTRKRPYTTHGYKALIHTWLLGGSFPSDHAMMAAIFGSILFLLGGWWLWMAPLLIGGVMIGRVMAGVHYPSDVITGSIIGCLSVFGAYFLIFL
ncbi:hypothetical protein COV06_02440 [Candidatus Uhrbacteria bacterium CG10_big_fil_rev_8_21_14_0_10_50_16]|uniref:Phosphatidic acid phosphatase type 2/haloperoxidase domain-containing protein n=1 Tax=Candidatus Uhrbacteria bacterium CG10_big_fil_rev_8_21_14_0_10_50_16 TaxID=1975039 RepID=A0A2H0RMF5_9BACT|nr:MAG: hypothetical protein COV06_02440 [Candidatus Uhrbacteria bacterium CG10_big_fil_rev_8_21_14_0_10_50_16]